jgi:murein DD-endopeptidase MepM/ murein hydrolase activator NlpD
MRRRVWWAAAAALTLAAAAPALWVHARQRAARAEREALRAQVRRQARRIARQREEIAQLGAAVDDLARVTAGARERLRVARRIAHLAADGATDAVPPPVTRAELASDAALVRAQLTRVARNAQLLSDSVAILTALVQERQLEIATAPSLWPVHGTVTSDFGPRRSPDGAGSEQHPGLDIRAGSGTPVVASGAGEVLFAGRDPGYGVLVILGHSGDVQTFYGHLSAAYVHAGQQVRRGAVIGAVGSTGRVTGPHLHFEVRVHGEPVDPHRYLAPADGSRAADGARGGGSQPPQRRARRDFGIATVSSR